MINSEINSKKEISKNSLIKSQNTLTPIDKISKRKIFKEYNTTKLSQPIIFPEKVFKLLKMKKASLIFV